MFRFYVLSLWAPRGWQWSSCKHLPPPSSDLSSTLSSNSLSFACSMKYNNLIQFLMKPQSPPSHVYIHWSLPWVYTLSVKISLLVVPGGVHFVNTDYKSWPDFILVCIIGKTEDKFQTTMWIVFVFFTCSNSSRVRHLLCIFYHVVGHELCEGGVPGKSKELESFFFRFPFNLCLKTSFWYLEDNWQSGLWLPGHLFILHNGHLAWVELSKSAGILRIVKVCSWISQEHKGAPIHWRPAPIYWHPEGCQGVLLDLFSNDVGLFDYGVMQSVIASWDQQSKSCSSNSCATLTSSRIVICYNFDLEVLVLVPTLTVKGAAGWKTTPRLSPETRTPDFMKHVGF